MAEFLVDLAALAQRPRPPAEVGGKARNLATLLAAGLRVPPGFVLLADERRVWSQGSHAIDAALDRASSPLGDRLVVRSSASIEDAAGGGAAGVFSSVRDVRNERAALRSAARRVCESASAETTRIYLATKGIAQVHMAVLVQTQVEGTRGVLYSRPPGDPDGPAMAIEIAGEEPTRCLRVARAGPIRAVPHAPLPDAALTQLVAAGLAVERALAMTRGVDMEWVWDGAQLWVVQARAIQHPAQQPRPAPAPEIFSFSRAEPHRTWQLDASHNPEPLSLAQQGLVARVTPLVRASYSMRCVGGYLYTSPTPSSAPPEPATARAETPLDPRQLEAQRDALSRAAEQALAPLEGADPASLKAALGAYDAVYAIYAGPMAHAIAAARATLAAAAEQAGVTDMHALTRARGALLCAFEQAAAGQISFDQLRELATPVAQAWDVAAPTYGDRPDMLRAALDAFSTPHAGQRAGTSEAHAQLAQHIGRERAAALMEFGAIVGAWAEDDDLLFWRAQAGVRRALTAAGERLGLAQGDVFCLALRRVVAWEADATHPPPRTAQDAERERAILAAEARVTMPLWFRDGAALPEPAAACGEVWRGHGSGGSARGQVWRVETTHQLACAPPGTIVVARTASPAMALIARGAAALVCEHGGLLGHGAALARELGIPCVVGCRNAWRQLAPGDQVWVDGETGRVVRLGSR